VVAGLIFGGLIPYPVRRHGDDGCRPGRRLGGRGSAPAVPEKPGIMEGKDRPDYARAVDLLTKAAIKEMIIPSLLPVLSPLVVYFGDAADLWLQGLGLRRTRRHAARCDRQRPVRRHLDDLGRRRLGQRQEVLRGRLCRQGRRQAREGFGSPQGSVTGDTVGDPYKDTAGPAVNPAIKITNIVALLLLAVLAH
jgi:K(+)-stimulated pyrophosphate-energized sodium pump